MEKGELVREIIGSKIYSPIYGEGVISNVCLSDKINFIIDFGTNISKTFVANIAVPKGSISFIDEEIEKKYVELEGLMGNKSAKIVEKIEINNKSKNIVGISNNSHINNLIRKFKKGESISIDLISLYNNFKFESDLLTQGFMYFEMMFDGNYVNDDRKKLIVIMLSFIALKYYDGDLHSQIKSKYREYRTLTEKNYSDSTINNNLYKLLVEYRKVVKYFDHKSYNAVPIILACVPHYRINHLYKLAYDIYKKKLLFDEDVSDEQIEEKVYESLNSLNRKNLISDSEVIKGTEYLMPKYTQSCIYSGYNLQSLVKIISHCIRLIIDHLTRLEDAFIVEDFYKEGFSEWVNIFETSDKERKKYEENRLISRPYFRLKENNKIHIITGKCCMDDSFDPNNVSIDIYVNNIFTKKVKLDDSNDVIYNDEGAMGGYIIGQKDIVLECSPINYLSYKIVCDGRIIYDSKNRLFRKNLFFNGNGNEVKPGTTYNGDIFVVAKEINDDEYEQKIYKNNEYGIYIVEVNDKSIYRFDDEPYVFFKIQEPKLIGYRVPWAEFEILESKKYLIYKEISVIFQASCDKEEIYISIDGIDISYGENREDINYKIFLFANENNGFYAYKINIYGLSAGYHTLKIYNIRTEKIIKNSELCFIYDQEIDKKYISKDSEKVIYNIFSSFLKNDIKIEYKFSCTSKTIDSFITNLGYGKLYIYPTNITYSLDKNTWFDLDHKLYICDLEKKQNEIYLCGPENLCVYTIESNSVIKKRKLNCNRDGESRFRYILDISYLKTLRNIDSIKISFEFGAKNKYLLAWMNPFINIEQCEFFYDEKLDQHNFSFSFEGNRKIWAIFAQTGTDNIIYKRLISNNETITILNNEIPKDIHYLTVSLHRQFDESLFKQYVEEPIKTFKKYCVDRVPLIAYGKPNICYNEINESIFFSFNFGGVEKILLKVFPSGFNEVIYEGEVFPNKNVLISIKNQIYNSYNLLLFKPKAPLSTDYEENPFYTSIPIKTTSLLLKKLQILEFGLENSNNILVSGKYIFLNKIETIDCEKMLLGKIINIYDKISTDNVLIKIDTFNSQDVEGIIYIKRNNQLFHLKNNGEKIIRIRISR